MRRGLLALALVVAGCSPARAPAPLPGDLARAWAEAAEAEAHGAPADALTRELDVLARATASPAAPHAQGATLATLDALALRRAPGLDRVTTRAALAFRVPGALDRAGRALDEAWARADGDPFARPAIARAARALALQRGDATAASTWLARTGCARAAATIGPVAWPALAALATPTAIEARAPFAASYAGIAPFAATAAPLGVVAEGCDVPVEGTSVLEGLRVVAIDADVPRAQTIGLTLRSAYAAVVTVGGRDAITRGIELGGSEVARRARVALPAGRARIVVRVAAPGEGAGIAVEVTGADGAPLATSAPRTGDVADAVPTSVEPLPPPKAGTDANEIALAGAAALADGDARTAEHLLEEATRAGAQPPLVSLMLGRARTLADDLPASRAAERGRELWSAVQRSWPIAWEAIVGHALLTAQRRGATEGRFEALAELDEARRAGALDPLVRAFEAHLAAEAGLRDAADAALEELRARAAGTPLLAAVEMDAADALGAERERLACADGAADRASLACLDARATRGDHAGTLAEIARLRELGSAPGALRGRELAARLAMGDEAGALAVHEAMRPVERTVATLALLAPDRADAARARAFAEAAASRDAAGALGPLLRLLGDDPAREGEARVAAAIAEDRAAKGDDGAATLVLFHDERYDLAATGLLRWTLHDVRRVSGTTDVETGAQVFGPSLEARDVRRLLRRRIWKRDGRVLEPDRPEHAQQGHTDLSQLEKGDWVETAVEGWALPGASGQLVIDTPDLLPERTGVRAASVEVRAPAALALATWSHADLGKAEERRDGDALVRRWLLASRAPRRLESGVARMDRDVSVSVGTATWALVGRAVAESALALADDDPLVVRWANDAARAPEGDQAGERREPNDQRVGTKRAIVERVVAAAGRTLRIAQPGVLADFSAMGASGAQALNARGMIELGEGSRSWLVARALRVLGIPADIVVAEHEPFSADPAFPAHFGRFEQPLVVAHVDGTDVWIDADVAGPPLPAGRVSPELRGRRAIGASGEIVAVGGVATDDARDEIDVRLAVDARGDAKGTFLALLRGRQAQALADALELVVGSQRRDLLRGVVLGWLPWANVDDVTLSSSEGSWQVSVRAAVTIPGYAQPAGATWVLPGLEPLHTVYPRASTSTLATALAPERARKSALAVTSSHLWHARRRVELPPGTTLTRPPPGIAIHDAAIEATRTGGVRGDVVEEDFTLSLPTGTVDAARFGEFAAALARIDGAFLGGARVSRPAVAKP